MERSLGSDSEQAFGPSCQQAVREILGLKEHPNFPAFWERIKESGLVKRRALKASPSAFRISPTNLTATQRITWLNRNVLRPIKRIRHALTEENLAHFAYWEDALLDPESLAGFSNRERLLTDLAEFETETERLIAKLETDLKMKVHSTDEARFTIVYDAVADLHEHFPDFVLSRGNWDPELKKMVGVILAFVRRVFLETTGQHEQLDGPIRLAIEDLIKSQLKST